MATKDPSHDAGSHRIRSPITAAVTLLGIYVAMYLAVAGVVHILASPDAAAATASTFAAAVGESPPSDSLGQVSGRTDNSRECRPSTATDSKCPSK